MAPTMLATPPAFPDPAPWTNQDMLLYHGTIRRWCSSIDAGVDVAAGRAATDFGQGFYTTTVLTQARSWAWEMSRKSKLSGTLADPVVYQFAVARDDLAPLSAVWFVRGTADAEDYWSLVAHCRSGGADHARGLSATASRAGWYDVVIGPVAASWRQRLCLQGCDQISFHSAGAAAVLDASTKGLV